MEQQKQITVVGIVCTLAALMLPASAALGNVSAQIQISPDKGGLYWNLSHQQMFAYEYDITLTAIDLAIFNFQTYGYSVDVSQDIGSGNYPVTLTELTGFSDTYYEIAWLMDTFAGQSGISSDYEAMGLGALIHVTLTGNTNTYAPDQYLEVTTRSYYDFYNNALANLTLDQQTRDYLNDHYMVAASVNYKDIMVRMPDTEVIPAPSSSVLLGIGLFCGPAILSRRIDIFTNPES